MEMGLLFCLIVLLTHHSKDHMLCMAIQESYHVMVNNSGPVVIDSLISFQAKLNTESVNNITATLHSDYHNASDQSMYLYTWLTNACLHSKQPSFCNENITSNDTAVLSRVYSKFDVPRGGKFLMMVIVYKRDVNGRFDQIAVNSTYFILTATINGHLLVSQNTTAISHQAGDVFSTKSNITLMAVITDHFSDPTFTSVWCIIGPQTNVSIELYGLSHSVLLSRRGSYKLYVAIIVHIHVFDQMGKVQLVERNTSFNGHILMKDAVSKISLLGSTRYTVGMNLSVNVICLGSGPFHMTLMLSAPDQSVIQEVKDISSSCYFHVTQPYLDIVGIYSMNATIENDVSRTNHVINIDVVKELPPGYGAVVPVFAVMISILAPAVILYAYILDRRRHQSIEYADFSFRNEENKAHHRHTIINKIHVIVKLACARIWRDSSNLNEDENGEDNNFSGLKMKMMTGNYEAIT